MTGYNNIVLSVLLANPYLVRKGFVVAVLLIFH